MLYDAILSYLGEFGLYQKRKVLLVCSVCIPHGIQLCAVVFNFAESLFRCAVPGLDNDTYHIQNEAHRRLVDASVPIDSDTGQYSQCDVYGSSRNGSFSSLSEWNPNHTTPCHRWVFHPDRETATSTWHVVCDRQYLQAHVNLMVMLGLLAGSFCGGPLSDYFGRKKVLVVSPVGHALCSVAMTFVTSPVQYMILRFLTSFLGVINFLTAFVMVAEIVGPRKRTMAELGPVYGWCVGVFLLALVDYLIPNWRLAQLVLSVPWLGFISFWWLLDESPRWLLVKGRTDEAMNIMEVISKINGTKMPDNLEVKPTLNSTQGGNATKEKIWHVCVSRVLVTRLLILCVGWCASCMVYFGLTLNVGSLVEGSLYVNFTVQALLESISYVTCHLLLGRVGRKPIYCGSLLLAGCACLAMTAPVLTKSNAKWISVLLLGLGKFGITASFTLVFIVTAELLPTSVRNSGLGFCSFVGRVAGLISPYVASLGFLMSSEYGVTFPLALFGMSSVLAGLLALCLPESSNQKLPETMKEAKSFGRTVDPNALDGTRV